MKVKIISDGSSDLPKEIIELLGIEIVPLFVHFGTEQYSSSELTAEQFYSKMKQADELPKTSSPSPYDFLKAYRNVPEGYDIVVIACSSGLSSTYNHAVMAKEMLIEEGYAGVIEVLDARTTSLGLGLIAYQAAKMAQAGAGAMDIIRTARQHIQDGATYFVLDTLENVIRGGRLDRVRGTVASMLNIKLLMRNSEEGKVEVIDKIRGSQNAIKKMMDKIGEARHDFGQAVVAIAHSNCEEKAKAVRDMLLQRYPFKDVVFGNMGPVIGTYAGEGAILIAH
ncbi:DegV family protein [Paenibacillus turpanensis]|uniref:DegV family protein n=1 Tax=Paenibacillus turpanensis TaxID=2689078 RepID=UPI0014072E12|nr:DegV family protein [Paenibacillus turpanensis]